MIYCCYLLGVPTSQITGEISNLTVGGSEESAEQHHVCERAGEQARRIVEWWLLGDYTALCVSLRTSWTENDGFVLPCVGLHCDQDDSAKGFMAGCVCVCVCGVQVST